MSHMIWVSMAYSLRRVIILTLIIQFVIAGLIQPCRILFDAVSSEALYFGFFKRTVPEFKIYQHESMNYYFFVLIFLSQQILGLSETQFDRVFNQNYHSKSRHVSARSWKSLKITRLKFNH